MLLKTIAVYNNFKILRNMGLIIRKERSGRKSNHTKDIQQKIEKNLSDYNDLL